MEHRSPTLEGFRAILRKPSLGFAEIAWRWSFGTAAALLIAFSFLEYLDTLPVTRGDLLLLKSRQPVLISHAISHIFRGSSWRVVQSLIILGLALAAGWIAIAALARAATIKAVLAYFRQPEDLSRPSDGKAASLRLSSLFGLNFFRVGVTLAAAVGCLAALLLGGAASPAGNPSPGTAFLIFLSVAMLVWLAWSVLNWFLSLASVFAVAEGRDTFGAIASAVSLCRSRAGSVFAAGTWFGLAHIAAFVAATTAVAFPLSMARVLPAGVVLGGVLAVTLLYFAAADFLYMGRLAAYVAIIEFPPSPVAETRAPIPPVPFTTSPPAPVDQEERILCDVPAPSS